MIDNPTGYVFLDVDGIINPFDRDLRLPGWHLEHVGFWDIWVGDPLAAWLRGLIDHGVQIVWATTWVENPDNLAELAVLWGLPTDLPGIDGLEWAVGDRYSCGKRPGVIRWLNANGVDTEVTPVVWVDDMLGPLDLRWAEARGVVAVPVPSEWGLADPTQPRLIEDALGVIPVTSGCDTTILAVL